MPEPHILLSVVQGTDFGSPAPKAAWRAGAWPWPAPRTLPISTSSTSSAATPARSSAALIVAAPNWLAVAPVNSPWKPPIGVRAALTMTIGSDMETSPPAFCERTFN